MTLLGDVPTPLRVGDTLVLYLYATDQQLLLTQGRTRIDAPNPANNLMDQAQFLQCSSYSSIAKLPLAVDISGDFHWALPIGVTGGVAALSQSLGNSNNSTQDMRAGLFQIVSVDNDPQGTAVQYGRNYLLAYSGNQCGDGSDVLYLVHVDASMTGIDIETALFGVLGIRQPLVISQFNLRNLLNYIISNYPPGIYTGVTHVPNAPPGGPGSLFPWMTWQFQPVAPPPAASSNTNISAGTWPRLMAGASYDNAKSTSWGDAVFTSSGVGLCSPPYVSPSYVSSPLTCTVPTVMYGDAVSLQASTAVVSQATRGTNTEYQVYDALNCDANALDCVTQEPSPATNVQVGTLFQIRLPYNDSNAGAPTWYDVLGSSPQSTELGPYPAGAALVQTPESPQYLSHASTTAPPSGAPTCVGEAFEPSPGFRLCDAVNPTVAPNQVPRWTTCVQNDQTGVPSGWLGCWDDTVGGCDPNAKPVCPAQCTDCGVVCVAGGTWMCKSGTTGGTCSVAAPATPPCYNTLTCNASGTWVVGPPVPCTDSTTTSVSPQTVILWIIFGAAMLVVVASLALFVRYLFKQGQMRLQQVDSTTSVAPPVASSLSSSS